MYKIGIDIGGTNTRVAVVKETEIVEFIKRDTHTTSPKKNFKPFIDEMKKWINKYDIKTIGISAPGPLSIEKTMILFSTNLKKEWHMFSFRDYFKKELGNEIEVNINNDANLLAYANALFGKEASKHRIVQYFTFSTGTGAGLVYDKKIFSGANDFAQEIANIPAGIEGFSYDGLNDEAIEAIGSGTGIVKYALHLGMDVSSTEDVFKLYEKKDPLAIQVISLSQKSIAKLFATTIALINPGVIVLGGPVALKNKWFIEGAIELSNNYLFDVIKNKTKYVYDEFLDKAGIIGAANL